MKPTRALTLSIVVAASLILTGCSSTVDGRALDDGKGCLLSPTGLCIRPDDIPTTTTTTATPQRQETTGSVRVCDGTDCDLTDSPDEISRLVARSLADVDSMWARINVPVSVEMYKGGIGSCEGDGSTTATAWVCPASTYGGWNPEAIRVWAAKRGASIEDTVWATMAHEMGHLVLHILDADSDDLMTNETRADCMAGGYSRWTQGGGSSMGVLPLSTMKNVLYGEKSVRALDTGYNGTPKDCMEFVP